MIQNSPIIPNIKKKEVKILVDDLPEPTIVNGPTETEDASVQPELLKIKPVETIKAKPSSSGRRSTINYSKSILDTSNYAEKTIGRGKTFVAKRHSNEG